MTPASPRSPHPRRVFVLGATGTIGRATVAALVQRGHEVVCFIRARAGVGPGLARERAGPGEQRGLPARDPVGADEIAEAVAAHRKLGRHDQSGVLRRGPPHSLFEGTPVRRDLPGTGGEME